MNQVMDYIEMKIPAKPDYVGVIRLTLSGIASRMGFTYEEIEDIKIAISEATTNAVQHAYQNDEGGEIIVGFGIYPDKLEMMVADYGQSFNFIQTKKRTRPLHKIKYSGRFGRRRVRSIFDRNAHGRGPCIESVRGNGLHGEECKWGA